MQCPVEDRGSGPTLLLVHGFPLDHSMWQGQIDGLSDICRVIAPDLRGFGKNKAPLESVVTMEQFADDLAHLLDQLNIQPPICFCGLSMGGYIAWQFWQRHRRRIGQLILCDTRAVADTDDAARNRLEMADHLPEQGSALAADAMLPKLFSESTYQHRPDLVESTRQVMLQTKPASIAAAQRGLAQRADVTAMLPRIDVPTLVVCGEHDLISPVEEMRGIAAAIPGAQFHQIKDVGHMAPLEDPQAVNRAIRDFIESSYGR